MPGGQLRKCLLQAERGGQGVAAQRRERGDFAAKWPLRPHCFTKLAAMDLPRSLNIGSLATCCGGGTRFFRLSQSAERSIGSISPRISGRSRSRSPPVDLGRAPDRADPQIVPNTSTPAACERAVSRRHLRTDALPSFRRVSGGSALMQTKDDPESHGKPTLADDWRNLRGRRQGARPPAQSGAPPSRHIGHRPSPHPPSLLGPTFQTPPGAAARRIAHRRVLAYRSSREFVGQAHAEHSSA